MTTTWHSRGITLRGETVDDATENESDRGARLTVHSSHGARNSIYGEGIRLVLDTAQAKNMIAWYDNYTDPGRLRPKAWFGCHYGTYPDIVHDHIAIETPGTDGALHSRFHVSTAPSNKPMVSVVNADFIFSCGAGGRLRVGVDPGAQERVPRDITFESSGLGMDAARRWALRADTAPETGANAGSNFSLIRYADDGTALGTALVARRSDGHFGIGTRNLTGKVNIARDTGLALVVRSTSASPSGVIRVIGGSATSPALDTRLATEPASRYELRTEGKMWWGPGTGLVDTNLYRADVGTLATDHDFEIASSTRGLILRSGNGTRRRIHVNDAGELYTTAI